MGVPRRNNLENRRLYKKGLRDWALLQEGTEKINASQYGSDRIGAPTIKKVSKEWAPLQEIECYLHKRRHNGSSCKGIILRGRRHT